MPPKKQKEKTTSFEETFKQKKNEKIAELAGYIAAALPQDIADREGIARDKAKEFIKSKIDETKRTSTGTSVNAHLMRTLDLPEKTLKTRAQGISLQFENTFRKEQHDRLQQQHIALQQGIDPSFQVQLDLTQGAPSMAGAAPSTMLPSLFFSPQSIASGSAPSSLVVPSSLVAPSSLGIAPPTLRRTGSYGGLTSVSRMQPPLTIGSQFGMDPFANAAASLPPASPMGSFTAETFVAPSEIGDAVRRNIQTSAGGGGEHAMMPHSDGAFDIQFPTHNLISGALDKQLKPAMHAMLLAQTPNVYQSENVKDGNILRDIGNPPKRSDMIDIALWGQSKGIEMTPHSFFKVGESYSNPAKIGAKSCWDKFTANDPYVNLAGMLGAPFGTDLDDRWTQGVSPFFHPDRQSFQPGTYSDFTKSFTTGFTNRNSISELIR